MSVLILHDLPGQKLSPRASSPPVPGPTSSMTGSHHLVAQFLQPLPRDSLWASGPSSPLSSEPSEQHQEP